MSRRTRRKSSPHADKAEQDNVFLWEATKGRANNVTPRQPGEKGRVSKTMDIYALAILILVAIAIIGRPKPPAECERCKVVRRSFKEK